MKKFVIKNIIIEKSAKDINTGVNYEFKEGLNLICGNNEAGKSSLMNFIKQGLFREKNVDTGKIYFYLASENSIRNYRADIKDARLTEPRLKLYDENNNSVSYDFIAENINQKYFEQGFCINLDDLMNIQNKDTALLVDVIKDPFGEELACFTEEKKAEAKKILGEKNRLTKEITLIFDEISNLNNKIVELTNKETQYNNAVNLIKSLTEEIELLCTKEKYADILSELKIIQQDLELKENELNRLKLSFNEQLFNERETYLNVIQNAGRYESDIRTVEKNKNKICGILSEINSDINRLNSEYTIKLDENDIINYDLDFSKIKKIKDLTLQKISEEKEIVFLNSNKDNIEENLLKLRHEMISLQNKSEFIENTDEFKNLYLFLDESLKEYNFLLSKINNTKGETKSKSLSIDTNGKYIILSGILFFLSAASAIFAFWQKISTITASAIVAILFFAGIISLITACKKSENKAEFSEDELRKNQLLYDIKEKLKDNYPEILNIEISYLPFKAESIKQNIQNKIQNYNDVNELIEKNKQQTDYNLEKLNLCNDKISKFTAKTNDIKNTIHSLINSSGFNIEETVYIDVIDIIKNAKENIEEKNLLQKETQELLAANEEILKDLHSFLLNNKIDIPLSEKYEENIAKLKEYNDNNTEIKRQLDIINAEIQNIKIKQEKLTADKSEYIFDENCDYKQEEIIKEKDEKNNLKKEAEFKKRELESFEGLDDLKIERNILLDSYRKKIAELVKNKMIISLIESAKNNFNKICPNLKNSQKYLSILTGGKYSIINLDLAEIQNENKTITKKWAELSRGTKEQLYLALRLGYASNYSKDKATLEPNGKADLPLITDDAFVNFDAERTKNAVRCLLEFSKTNQVFLFTCHGDAMKKHIDCVRDNEEINIINM